MSRTKLSHDDLLERLSRVFREEGYSGASLSRLVLVSGLQRASLYHRFPGGKRDMARSVIVHAQEVLEKAVIAPLESDRPVADRIRVAFENLALYYENGTLPCVMDSMMVGNPEESLKELVQGLLRRLTRGFECALKAGGADDSEAKMKAEFLVASLQGALVVGRGTGDQGVFERALKHLPGLMLNRNACAAIATMSA